MKILTFITLLFSAATVQAQLPAPGTEGRPIPFADAAGENGSTAIHMNSPRFSGWADGYTALSYGSHVADVWKSPEKAIGKARGNSGDVVSLGRGGTITMTFSTPIVNGDGYDFAVFENSISDVFLELGWVEVSSDGIHFCRFPNYYTGNKSVGGFGGHSPTDIYGLASKYRQGYGTPFDLQELQDAYDTIQNGKAFFLSDSYKDSITDNFPHLDLNSIGYVKIIDIVGDGSAYDATGCRKIYDPYPTVGSAGFDLDAIGVINQSQEPDLTAQAITFNAIPNQKLADNSIYLNASSSSGLPVGFAIHEGPAYINGTTLIFSGTGRVTVQAYQPGNDTYAPAANVLRSFEIAEHTQHIYLAPVPNLLENSTHQLYARSSMGLPVSVEVTAGDAVIDSSNLLSTGKSGFGIDDNKTLTLRAYQSGDSSTAAAQDISITVNVVKRSSKAAPQTFSQWCAAKGIPADGSADNDSDGFNNFDEFMAGTSPVLAAEKPSMPFAIVTDSSGRRSAQIALRIRRRAQATLKFQHCETLKSTWKVLIPEIKGLNFTLDSDTEYVEINLKLPAKAPSGFYRALFEE